MPTPPSIPGVMPYYRRAMVFVDGTNFIGQLGKELGVAIEPAKPLSECFELASHLISKFFTADFKIIRRYWFGSYTGSEEEHFRLCSELRRSRFEPVLFRRKNRREKGVDIALTKEMLVNAFNQNFDTGLLIAGDEDYLGLVQEVKRYGQEMKGAFFSIGLSDHLRLAMDEFQYLRIVNQGPQIEQILAKIREQYNPNDVSGED